MGSIPETERSVIEKERLPVAVLTRFTVTPSNIERWI
jgi:hypothetical protein